MNEGSLKSEWPQHIFVQIPLPEIIWKQNIFLKL